MAATEVTDAIREGAQLIRDNAAERVHPIVDAFEHVLLAERAERELRAYLAANPVEIIERPVVTWLDQHKAELRDKLAAHTAYPNGDAA